MNRQIATARLIFETAADFSEVDGDDPIEVEQFLRNLRQEIHKVANKSDFKHDRLNSDERKAAGLDISRRRYKKLFRHLARMDRKLQTYRQSMRSVALTEVGKLGIGYQLEWESFSSDVNTACFIAYLTARKNRGRLARLFALTPAFDDCAAMLFRRCERSETTNWLAVAQVLPSREVVARLTDEQKGMLLGNWFSALEELSTKLHEVLQRSAFNYEKMLVSSADNFPPWWTKSSWNRLASAWNKSRTKAIELVHMFGMSDLLQGLYLGKVVRVNDTFLSWRGRTADTDTDPNIKVWSELPFPWEVLSGKAICTRSMVAESCLKNDLDPEKSGWIISPPRTQVADKHPTLDLVHGVAVANPFLAKILRELGFRS